MPISIFVVPTSCKIRIGFKGLKSMREARSSKLHTLRISLLSEYQIAFHELGRIYPLQ